MLRRIWIPGALYRAVPILAVIVGMWAFGYGGSILQGIGLTMVFYGTAVIFRRAECA